MKVKRIDLRPRRRPGRALLVGLALIVMASMPQWLAARGATETSHTKRYLVELRDPPLARYDGRDLSVKAKGGAQQLQATRARTVGASRLDVHSTSSRAYLEFLQDRHEALGREAAALLSRPVEPVYRYRVVTNGVALDLTQAEAERLSRSPLVKRIVPERLQQLQTYAGPEWIGAAQIWNGEDMLPQRRGENIVIGIIDSGINWDHPSFANPSGGYSYSNPLGQELGLCADGTVECNGKIIGIYDFVQDDPDTEDVEEENTNGRDNYGHGSHVSSIAAGNPVNVNLEGSLNVTVSGVAPRANIVSYRVCYVGIPAQERPFCPNLTALQAIEQAVTDGVDVINYSLGGDAFHPWYDPISMAFLSARDAGVFVATSAGNSGPEPGTIGSPADAPWIVAVGNATHNKIPALPFDLEGGPTDLACVEGDGPQISSAIGQRPVVFAGDAGDPLGCSAFPAGSMDGAIALVQRGGCTFAIKADNAAAAGADLMVILNNIAGPPVDMGGLESSTIPSCAVSKAEGETALAFVQADPSPRGQLNYPIEILSNGSSADMLHVSSSVGPAPEPAKNTLKPNLIAPGTSILAAIHEGSQFDFLTGTSMSSPHVAGAGALLLSVHDDWGPSELASALITTATAELATDHAGSPATPLEVGAGRPRLGEAAAVGLYLEETTENFLAANPAEGGDSVTLNLPGLVQSNCAVQCSFSRRVTDLAGGATWTATPIDFPPGVEVTVSPAGFALAGGASRDLTIDVDLSSAPAVDSWYFGRIRLSSAGLPDQYLTTAVYSGKGDLPDEWTISDSRDGGWKEFALDGLAALSDATYRAGGLAKQIETVEVLKQDPTDGDPYDSEEGTFTEWHNLPEGGMWLYAEITESTATDIDLFVGRDDNGNGQADESEELCRSTTPDIFERCDLYDVDPGNYWILVQNWEGDTVDGNEVTLHSAGVGPAGEGNLSASGPGIVPALESFPVRVSWDNLQAVPGEVWLGAIGIGTQSGQPDNVGVIPLRFTRTAVAAPMTFPLVPGTEHGLALAAKERHDRLFIDVPPGTSRLDVFTQGASAQQNNDLVLELKRLDFDAALADPPFAVAPTSTPVFLSAEGVGGKAPSISIFGVQSGRWYAVLRNTGSQPASATIRAELHFEGEAIVPRPGLWEPSSRPGLRQGFDFNRAGPNGALLWYTYDEANQPTWYLANAPVAEGSVWSADLLRFTNDGQQQQYVKVGQVVITALAEDDLLFTYTLFGLSGTDRMTPTSLLSCPDVGGQIQSYTGLWDRGVAGVGGGSILVSAQAQGQVHYVYDQWGEPRWLLANDLTDPAPTKSEIPLLQFHGYCAVCDPADVGFLEDPVGLLSRSFSNEAEGSWTLDYVFEAPLSGSAQRSESIAKLTDRMDCQ